MTAVFEEATRIDKWLWFVRIYKTRSMATDACNSGKVTIDGINVKPSRIPKIGDVVMIKKPPVTFSFKINGFPKSRVSAKLAGEYLVNLTPDEEMEKLRLKLAGSTIYRDKGTGRPTKKDRREMDDFFESFFE